MRKTLFLFLALVSLRAISQEYGVIAAFKSTSDPYAFKSIRNNCLPDYADAILSKNRVVFVVGDSTCGHFYYYLTVFDDGIRLIEKMFFADTLKVDSKLKTIKASHPLMSERIEKGRAVYVKYIEDEKRRLEMEEDANQKMMKDSLARLEKEYDKILSEYAKKNTVLYDWSWAYPSEYSSFPEIYVKIINPFKKRIKYVWVTFRAFNAVDDPVPAFRGNATGQGIGPIEYSETGAWNFDNIFYSKVIDKIKIPQIKLQFFDGTFKVISNPKSIF